MHGAVALGLALCVALAASPRVSADADERLVFQDEFDVLDDSHWSHLVSAFRGGNQEFQYYRDSRKNSYVRDGKLYVRPTFTADEFGEDFLSQGTLEYCNCNTQPDCISKAGADIVLPILSARLHTKQKFSFKYGRLEIRAKMPQGDWLWPALWLMPEEDKYGIWPRSGEIDLAETRGNLNLVDGTGKHIGIRRMYSTLHFGPAWNYDEWLKTYWDKELVNGTLADDFHVYGLEWSANGFRFTLDGELIGGMAAPPEGFWKLGGLDESPGGTDIWGGKPMTPFDEEFYIMINVAVGGNFFSSDDWVNSPYPRPWNTSSTQPMREFWSRRNLWEPTWRGEDAALQVDYVRVYQL